MRARHVFSTAFLSALIVLVVGYALDRLPGSRSGTLTLGHVWVDGEVATADKLNANPSAIAAVINGGIDDTNIASAGINAATKLKDSSISLAKMKSDSVNSSKIIDGSIGVDDVDFSGTEADGAWLQYDSGAGKLAWKTAPCMWVVNTYVRNPVLGSGGGPWSYDVVQTVDSLASANDVVIPQAMRLTAIYIKTTETPTNSTLFTLNISGSTTVATCTIGTGATSCSWTGDIPVAQGDTLSEWSELGEMGDAGGSIELYMSACFSPAG